MYDFSVEFSIFITVMPDQAWNTFLELLRAGLWEQDLQLAAVPDAAGWSQVLRLGRAQSVMGLLLRGIAHLPEAQRPPEALGPELQAWELALDRANARYARVHEALLAQFAAAGLHPRVLKGRAAAQYYAEPSARQVGDIDLFLPEGISAQAREMAPDARIASDGAAVFVRDGVTVELHPRYYDLHLDPSVLPAPGTPCGELLLLSAHIFKHAMGPGVGCKQLCDLARALTALDGRYDRQELAAALRRAGLARWHTLLCALLVADLGLAPSCAALPGAAPCRPRDLDALRRIVRAGGSFGLADAAHRRSRQRKALAKKTATAGAFLRRLPFSLRYGARETFATMWELTLGNLRR